MGISLVCHLGSGLSLRATSAINQAFEAGWQGLDIAERFPLEEIAQAHEFVEHPTKSGRVIVTI